MLLFWFKEGLVETERCQQFFVLRERSSPVKINQTIHTFSIFCCLTLSYSDTIVVSRGKEVVCNVTNSGVDFE